MEAYYSFNKSLVFGVSWDREGDYFFLGVNILFFEFGVGFPFFEKYDSVDQEIEERRR